MASSRVRPRERRDDGAGTKDKSTAGAGFCGWVGDFLRLAAIPKTSQVHLDSPFQLCRLGKLSIQLRHESRHFFLEWLAVVLNFLRADIAAGRQHMTVRGDFGGDGGFAETRYVFVFARALFSTPCVIGGDDFLDVGVGQFAVDAVDERSEFAGVDEEGLFSAVATFAIVFVPGQEPEADGYPLRCSAGNARGCSGIERNLRG